MGPRARALLPTCAPSPRVLLLAGVLAAAVVFAPVSRAQHDGPRLAIEAAGTAAAWVSYGGAPAFGFGLSPQGILTCLPPGEAADPDLDFRDFAHFATERGVTIVRSYPPSHEVGPRWLDAFERSASDPDRFDLERFNERYFERLREACLLFRESGIFVHLQLWQAVTWKKSWDRCYYNPGRNVNPELSRHAGPDEFVISPERDLRLIAHQRAWVRRILDATGDLGNVFYDVMNEIGNGTGMHPGWIEAMLDEFDSWERETGLEVLVGLNDEGRDRQETGWSLSNPRLDVAFLDLGRHEDHVAARGRYRRPTFGVRNIDWNPDSGRRQYFFFQDDLSISPDAGLRSRSARMYWRVLAAGVAMNAGYADWGALAYRAQPDCAGFLPTLPRVPALSSLRAAVPIPIERSPAPHAYARGAPGCVAVLLETTPGTAGAAIGAGILTLRLPPAVAEWAMAGPIAVRAWSLVAEAVSPFDPDALARAAAREVRLTGISASGELDLEVPRFRDGLAICIMSPEDAIASDPPPPSDERLPAGSPPWTVPQVVLARARTTQIYLWAKGNVAPVRHAWERRDGGGSWQPVGETATFTLNDAGLDPGTTYEYRVRALPPRNAPTAWSAPTAVATLGRRDLHGPQIPAWSRVLVTILFLLAAAVLVIRMLLARHPREVQRR